MRLISIFAVWFVFVQTLTGQTATSALPDSLRLQNSIAQAFALYQQTTGAQSHLYNGWEYVEYDAHIEGHQFFETDYMEEGSVRYDGVLYTQVPMLYDLVKDQLVIEHYNSADRIILIGEKVREFHFLRHTFVWLVADSSRENTIRSGFYDQLYNGRVKVFAKRVKIINEEIVQTTLTRNFIQRITTSSGRRKLSRREKQGECDEAV